MPKNSVYVKLAHIIEDLAEKCGSYAFEPHVTLLGDVPGNEEEIIARAGKIAAKAKPFDVELTSVDYTDKESMCLFARAGKSRQLDGLHRAACAAFGKPSDRGYTPHLSLLYGKYPNSIKEEIIGEIGRKFNEAFTADTIYVVHCSSDVAVKDWEVAKEISFGKR